MNDRHRHGLAYHAHDVHDEPGHTHAAPYLTDPAQSIEHDTGDPDPGYVYALDGAGNPRLLANGAGEHAKARAALEALRDSLDTMRMPAALGDRLAETVGDLAVRHLATLRRLVDVHELAGRESAGEPTGAPGPLQAIVHAPTALELTEEQLRAMPRDQFANVVKRGGAIPLTPEVHDELTAYGRHRAALAERRADPALSPPLNPPELADDPPATLADADRQRALLEQADRNFG